MLHIIVGKDWPRSSLEKNVQKSSKQISNILITLEMYIYAINAPSIS